MEDAILTEPEIRNTLSTPRKHFWKEIREGLWQCNYCRISARAYYEIPSWRYRIEYENKEGKGYVLHIPECK